MKTNYKLLNLFLSVIMTIGFSFTSAQAAVAEISTTAPAVKTPVVKSLVATEKITAGIKLLKSSAPLLYETSQKNLKGNLVGKQIALAILNKNTGEIFERRVWVKESDIKNFQKTGGAVRLMPAITGETLDVQAKWWNSFNSSFEVTNRPDLVVIADKYLLSSASISGLPEKSKNKYTDIIYVPYSKALHLPEIIGAGNDYLEKNIDQAYQELGASKVMSRFYARTLVTTNVSKDFIRNILLVEHIDPDSFNAASDGGRELTERVLALIGLNQKLAYRYTGSPAGASGLAQFIEPTYKIVVSSYPKAKLIKNYQLGMADHVNAIKAMVLFFDSRSKEINDRVVRRDVLKSLGITEEMLAAAYNGGGVRVSNSVNQYGLAWLNSQLNLSSAKKIFRKETLDYLRKFQAIKNMNLFASLL